MGLSTAAAGVGGALLILRRAAPAPCGRREFGRPGRTAPGMGAVGRGAAGEPHGVPDARLLPLAARQRTVARRAHRGDGRVRGNAHGAARHPDVPGADDVRGLAARRRGVGTRVRGRDTRGERCRHPAAAPVRGLRALAGRADGRGPRLRASGRGGEPARRATDEPFVSELAAHQSLPIPRWITPAGARGNWAQTASGVAAEGLVESADATPSRAAQLHAARPTPDQSSMCAGTLPPFAAICCMTCLCSQTFMVALSFMSPV